MELSWISEVQKDKEHFYHDSMLSHYKSPPALKFANFL